MNKPAQQFPGYQVISQIHDDADTAGYKCVRIRDRLPVVLKMLKPAFATPMSMSRFHNEYDIARLLNTELIIKIYGLESHEQSLVLVCEDFDGVRLDVLMRQWREGKTESPSPAKLIPIAKKIVECLAAVHAAGAICKDLHPSGIVWNSNTGVLKIGDFGIATALSSESPALKSPSLLKGKLAYMSPEQTGRMNRTVDHRTDFYSLGVIFHEMLTGRLPFEATDAMELVHAHLAKTPVPPHILNPAVPEVLSDLVLKLLAKAPEDRYQSANGLIQDLDMCLYHLRVHGEIRAFKLGRKDRSERFMIPERLYGRAVEIATLLEAFERAAQGPAELLLVAGFPGIGKTSVINEIHKAIVQRNGYFVKGKFDRFKHDTPFSAFVEAFRDLLGQWISEGNPSLEQCRGRLLDSLGNTGQIIIDVIPELERIIGSQTVVPELSGRGAQNRFYLQFQKFIAGLATPEHPLAIFLDDLQWADRSSLELMQLLISQSNIGHLLLLGAFRDNEVTALHPLNRMVNELEKSEAPLQILTLASLDLSDINQLIADALGCSPEMASPLADLVCRITQGNPFFNNQFLKALYEEGLITFDSEAGHWQCDISKIDTLYLPDNVVEFLAVQIQKLPAGTQQILKLAACIGNTFDLGSLTVITQLSETDAEADLWAALQAGLILPLNDTAKLYRAGGHEPGDAFNLCSPVPLYRFLHERVQQAAYFLIPEAQKKATHLHIARLLLNNVPEAEREEKLFEIVNQFNRGADLLADPAERQQLAALNLEAGQKARKAIAYRAAWEHFAMARQLLGENCWRSQYATALNMHECLVETAYLNGEFESMEELIRTARREVRTPIDFVKIFEVQCHSLAARGKYAECLDAGFAMLKSLGVEYPREPRPADIDEAFQETRLAYSDRSIESLIDLPPMTDPRQLAIVRIITGISSAAFICSYDIFAYLVLKTVSLSIHYGNTPSASHAYATYSQILCQQAWDAAEIESGYRFGQLAMDLVQRLEAKELLCRAHSVVLGFVAHWKIHVRDLLHPLLHAYYSGLEAGEFQYAAYAAYLYCSFPYIAGTGKRIPELRQEISRLSESIRQMKQEVVWEYFLMLQQALHDLTEGKVSSGFLKGNYFDEEALKPAYLQSSNWVALFDLSLHKLLLHYIYGDYRQAVENSDQAKQCLKSIRDLPYLPIFHLYDSLVRLAAYRETRQGNLEALLIDVEANQERLKLWSQLAPMNCTHKYHLVEAERHRATGDRTRAAEEYDYAITGAKENGYFREEAVANELAATLFLDWGKEKQARAYMQQARTCYAQWGARGKVVQLEQKYGMLLDTSPLAPGDKRTPPGDGTLRFEAAGSMTDSSLDLATVVKASHAMASEIELGPLLMQLMRILIENAGAQRGALILERYGDWVIEAQADVDNKEIQVLQSKRVQTSGSVCANIVYRVARTRNSVVLDDAAVQGDFVLDAYIARNAIKSVICAPLINQGKLSGIVYLENNLATHVFTAERLELLNLLSAQMALSLDNARLYQKAQEEIAERKLAETALQRSEVVLRATIESISDALLIITKSGRILHLNSRFAELWSIPEELKAATDARLLLEHILPKIVNPEEFHLRIHETHNALSRSEDFLHSKDGRIFEQYSYPLERIGEEPALVWLFRDVTERVHAIEQIRRMNEELEARVAERTAALEAANRELEAFSYSVSHDLRAPLRAIEGYTSILTEDHAPSLNNEGKRLCGILRSQSQRMSRLISDLLTFSRLKRAGLHLAAIDMESLAKAVFQELTTEESQRRIEFRIGSLPAASGDATLLRQVWTNLISNAIKFSSRQQQAVIEIHAAHKDNEITYSIRDNGAGFDMQYSDKLFGVFQRLHSENEFEGTGVGLAIVQQVIHRHGGRVWAEGEVGRGATFYFSLPSRGDEA